MPLRENITQLLKKEILDYFKSMIGIILGIFGILITIGFGIYSVVIYKKTRKTVSLEFENKECYSLFRDDVNRLNIELSYNKKPITNTLILLKARLRNNGHIDIDKNRIYNPLKVISSSDFQWLETTITSKPNGGLATVEILDSQIIQINWDLLKKDEFIELEALSETNESEPLGEEKALEFYNNLKFDFRITDLSSIHKEKQITSKARRRNFTTKLAKLTGTAAMVLGCIVLFNELFPEYSFLPESREVSFLMEKDSMEQTGYISSNNPNQLKLKMLEPMYEEKLMISEFNIKYKLKGIHETTPNAKRSFVNLIFSIVYIVLGTILLVLQFWIKRKMKRTNSPDFD